MKSSRINEDFRYMRINGIKMSPSNRIVPLYSLTTTTTVITITIIMTSTLLREKRRRLKRLMTCPGDDRIWDRKTLTFSPLGKSLSVSGCGTSGRYVHLMFELKSREIGRDIL